MNLIYRRLAWASVAGALCLGLAGAAAFAQSREGSEQPRKKAVTAHGTQVYVGRVTRIAVKDSPPAQTFMIYDDTHRANFFLSNPEDASRFEGEQARVEGTLDQENNTIRVQHINLYRGARYAAVGK